MFGLSLGLQRAGGGYSPTHVAHHNPMSMLPGCRIIHLLEGARARTMGFDISDGYNNENALSVFDVQHLFPMGTSSDEVSTVYALAFAQLN